MKRFIIIVCILVALGGGLLYAVYYEGFYVNLNPNAPITADFRTLDGSIQHLESGQWEPLEIRGVDVSSSLPGEPAMDFTAGSEDYLRWFESIAALGANTVRVYTIMDSDFYEAFYQFNTESGSTLYLLQGLQVSDAANYGAADAYDSDFRELLIQNGQAAVDVIHGRKNITLGDTSGTGIYHWDVSPWVLGYLVGSEWDSGNIAYTNNSTLHPLSYQGTYFTTVPEANRFEVLMAEVMDRIMQYETNKYKAQRLIAFVNDPNNDPFEYEDLYSTRFFKYNQVDAENIIPTQALRSGYFAAYRLSQFDEDFLDYLTQEQRAELGSDLYSLDTAAIYNGYLDLLGRYHTIPVVAAGFGFSTARAPVYEGEEPLTEQEQGDRFVEVSREAAEAGWAGVFVSTWQDVWERRTWNTTYATLDSLMPVWQDVQSDGQGYGLLQFSWEEKPACVVDGSSSEWTEEDVVLSGPQGSLSMRYDEKYLYFFAEPEDFDSSADILYIPIDTTQESGSTYCENYDLSFERACDFVICIDRGGTSRVVVQERYETLWAMHAYETDRVDPYDALRDKNSPLFRPIRLLVQREDPVPVGGWEAYPTYETGILREGNADPDAADYNSLADFHFTYSGVEIRIPWELLNFGNPSEMMIHDDYYENYGVEYIHIDEMYVGMAAGDATEYRIPMTSFALEGWGKTVTYHERLKESYYILQEYWRKLDR